MQGTGSDESAPVGPSRNVRQQSAGEAQVLVVRVDTVE